MTADGTYRSPRAGETITTEIEALPDGAVVLDRDGDAWQSDEGRWFCARASLSYWGSNRLAELAPLTVLFRPDAPQPATTDDAVERAARDAYPTLTALNAERRRSFALGARWTRAALAAAGAAEVVDREAAWREYATAERLNLDWRRSSHGHAFMAGAALSARGDAATPTEVEWGVRYDAPHPSGDTVYPVPDEAIARMLAAESEGTTHPMQRDVHRSAWREVTP